MGRKHRPTTTGQAMQSHPRDMNLRAAISASTVLVVLSLGLLWAAREPTDATAIAGATGLVVAGSLMGLTLLAWRWSRTQREYVRTAVGDAAGAGAATATGAERTVAARSDATG